MTFGAIMITCPGRDGLRQKTLAALAATDWGNDFPIYVRNDDNTCERRQERQERNSLAAVKRGLQVFSPDTVILFMEDDIIFNKHLVHNLQNWKPLNDFVRKQSHDGYFFGSLYDPNIRELESFPDDHYFVADPDAVYGSQCYVMSRKMAEYFVAHWWEMPGMQDIKMSRLAGGGTIDRKTAPPMCPIYYHMPCLVQHVGLQSAWGGHFHKTKTFDAEWRA